MKKIIALVTITVFILMLAGCAAGNSGSDSKTETKAASAKASEESKAADKTSAANNDTDNSSKTLVVYFSATGTTKGVAEKIVSALNADVCEITAAQPYTSNDLNYNDSDSRATREQNDKNVRPELGGEAISLDGYDTVYIGFPIWWGEEPRIMDTFVESCDFSGKTVIPFCTSGSSSIDNAGENLKENAGGGDWKDGKRFSADVSQSDIEEWLNSL